MQATLVACDALCDAVDDAEVLLSRGTSLLHKVSVYVEAGGRLSASAVSLRFFFVALLFVLPCKIYEAIESTIVPETALKYCGDTHIHGSDNQMW